MSRANRIKGNRAEQYYAKLFRELGFTFCKTSRQGSKLHDDSKIDLIFIPFNIQIKAGIQQNLNPAKELSLMKSMLLLNFPKEDEIHKKPCLLIHYKEVGKGNKRTENDELVYMSSKQFFKFKKLLDHDLFQNELIWTKKYNNIENKEFENLIRINFEFFKNNIIKKLYDKYKNNT